MKEKISNLLKKRFDFLGGRENDLPGFGQSLVIASRLPKVKKIVLAVFLIIFLATTVTFLAQARQAWTIEIPTYGGKITEGIIGTPRFVNPLLATTDPDRDLTEIIYSGLLRVGPNGELIPDLAETLEIDPEGLIYAVTLKEGLTWHDGEPVTTDDIEFTVNLARDEQIRSPRRANWEGVELEKKDSRTVIFILKQPYAPFIENFTMGILPKHIWKDIPAEQMSFSKYNWQPIGSGPFLVKKVRQNDGGIPASYQLESFRNFSLGRPFLDEIKIRFYENEEALIEAVRSGEINSASAISPTKARELKEKYPIATSPLPRIFAVFFNQNQNEVLSHKEVRKALDLSADKERIVAEALAGFGQVIGGPLTTNHENEKAVGQNQFLSQGEKIQAAQKILNEAGWQLDEETGVLTKTVGKKTISLQFSLATRNAAELKRVAEILKENWEKLGARIELTFFESADLNQNIIRPRKFDGLLFGEIIGRLPDPFAFWHSSQRLDPGLNIAQYTSVAVDEAVEKARTAIETEERSVWYQKFQEGIVADIPAVFLYSPELIYLLPPALKGMEIGPAANASERFLNIHQWFIYTDRVWKFFL